MCVETVNRVAARGVVAWACADSGYSRWTPGPHGPSRPLRQRPHLLPLRGTEDMLRRRCVRAQRSVWVCACCVDASGFGCWPCCLSLLSQYSPSLLIMDFVDCIDFPTMATQKEWANQLCIVKTLNLLYMLTLCIEEKHCWTVSFITGSSVTTYKLSNSDVIQALPRTRQY